MAKGIFELPDAEDYLDYAVRAAKYIDQKRRETAHGLVWDVTDAWTGKDVWNDEISLYTGSAGIIHFYLYLYEVTEEEQYLKDSIRAAEYIVYRWEQKRELTKCFSKWAYTTGWAGVAAALLEVDRCCRRELFRETVRDIIDAMITDAKVPESGEGRYWSTYPGIVGDAGTILFILEAAQILESDEYRDFAVEAGRYYLTRGEEKPGGGRYYKGVDPAFFGYPEDYEDPNFPMGTAGIGYLLLKLYEVSKDEAFLKAEEGVAVYLQSISVQTKDGAGALLPHALPYRRNLFYLSYCHGPAGTVRYFYQKYRISGKDEYLVWADKLAEGIIRAGAPEVHSEGYWHIDNFCCGTAGLLHAFLGMYSAQRDEKYLTYAKRCGRQLLGRAYTVSKEGRKSAAWYFAFDRIAPDRITGRVGYYDGAAGIGAVLLELALTLQGRGYVARAIDDPFPEKWQEDR